MIDTATENKEARNLVHYFEQGCVCLLTNKIEKCDSQDPVEAEAYYTEKCTCSRHPESATRDCWDKQLDKAGKAALKRYLKEQGILS